MLFVDDRAPSVALTIHLWRSIFRAKVAQDGRPLALDPYPEHNESDQQQPSNDHCLPVLTRMARSTIKNLPRLSGRELPNITQDLARWLL